MARLALALFLFAAQAGVLALALFAPQVDAAHRGFYLDRATDCLARPAPPRPLAADAIHPPALDPDTFCALFPRGFALTEHLGPASPAAWSTRGRGEIVVPLRPSDRAVALTLRGYAPAGGTQPVTLRADAAPARALAVPHFGLRTVCLARPGAAEAMRLVLDIAAPARPTLHGDSHRAGATGIEVVEIRRARDAGCR